MNKKFLSAILFGALMVTSTSTFVSCKDYDDDIKGLWDAVGGKASADDLKNQVDAMTTLLNDAQADADEALVDAKNAYDEAEKAYNEAKGKATAEQLAALETAYKNADTKLNEELAKKASLEEVNTKISALKKELNDALNKKVDQTEFNQLSAKVANLMAEVEYLAGSQLKSLVFAPELYMDGVESFEAKYLPYYALTVPATERKTTYNDIEYTTEEGVVTEANLVTYNNPTMYVNYHMNPTTVKVDQFKDNLSFISGDYDFVSTRAAKAAPKATYKSHKDGILTVAVDLAAQNVMNQEDENQFVKEVNNENKITTLALQALVEGEEADTTVVSDYAAVYASQIEVQAIAYPETAKIAYEPSDDCAEPVNGRHLFDDAIEAIAAAPTVYVAWNSSVNLPSLVEAHYLSNSASSFGNDYETKVWAYGDETAYNLKYEFELVTYKGGQNATSESANAQLTSNNTVLRPCGVVASTGLASGIQGIETVGRMPLVRVTLKDTQNNKNVAIGYIKFLIVESETAKETEQFDMKNVYYSCEGQFGKLTWAETQTELLGVTAATSKDTFDALYELELSGTETAQYMKSGEEYVAIDPIKYIGTVEEVIDATAPATTCLKWTVEQIDFAELRDRAVVNNDAKTIIAEHVVYVKYVGKGVDGNAGVAKTPIYVPIKLTFNYPYGTLNNKLANKWYAANSTSMGNAEIHVNVEVPKTIVNDAIATCNFASDLDNYFMINKTLGQIANPYTTATEADAPSFGVNTAYDPNKLAEDGQEGLIEWADEVLSYAYYFTPANDYRVSQTEVKGISGTSYKLYVGTTSDVWNDTNFNDVKIDWYDEAYNASFPRNYNSVALYAATASGNVKVLEIDPNTGLVTFQDNDTAKDLLNLVSHKDLAKTFTANIGVAAFNTCANLLPLADKTYNAKFLRPVDVEQGAVKNFTDAVDGNVESTETVNGAWAYVLNMVKLNDWRDQLFVTSTYATDGKNLDYFNYYEVEAITVDVENIRTDMKKDAAGKWDLLKNTNTAIYFKQVGATTGVPVANATMANLLSHYGKLEYFNNTGNTVEFNAELPITITYKWGEITIFVTCKIGGTLNN